MGISEFIVPDSFLLINIPIPIPIPGVPKKRVLVR